ncbi:PilZ domain-containing protein [Aureimonas ureilytica]|uniref:PilZ domain-containing protein n=1 Tax=Aureimonas ureilytica TaxID=401562 RepID=UPI00035F060B|nr:PilZ domain-containing protein [Aureimonas ureilytica]
MLERRAKARRRVCYQGSVTAGFSDPVLSVHIRDLSETGAQVRLPEGALPGRRIALRVDRTNRLYDAEVVWRAMEIYGLRFRHPGDEAGEAAGGAGFERWRRASF